MKYQFYPLIQTALIELKRSGRRADSCFFDTPLLWMPNKRYKSAYFDLYIRNLFDACWWFGYFPRFRLPEDSNIAQSLSLDILALLKPDHRAPRAVYERNHYFVNRMRYLGLVRSFLGFLETARIQAPEFFRLSSNGIWLPLAVGRPEKWEDVQTKSGRFRYVTEVCKEGGVRISFLSFRRKDPKLADYFQYARVCSIVAGPAKIAEVLPDAIVMRDQTKTVWKNNAAHNPSSRPAPLAGDTDADESNERDKILSRGVQKHIDINQRHVTYYYDLGYLKAYISRAIQALKFNHLGKIGRMIIHELNNPIGGIYNLAQLMRMSADESQADVHDNLARVESQCRRVKDIITHLSSYFRSQDHQDRVHIEPLDIKDLFDQVARLVQSVLGGARLDIDVCPETLSIESDRLKLLHILVNLVINAAEALKRTTRAQPLIELKAYVGPNKRVFIEVKDNGPGITPQTRARMFAPFYTTKKAPTPNAGIGLAIVRFFLHELGYSFTIDTHVGSGTRFIIEGVEPCQNLFTPLPSPSSNP